MKYEIYRLKSHKNYTKNDDKTEVRILNNKIDHLISLLNITIRRLGGQ
jgi:hypothetical protein